MYIYIYIYELKEADNDNDININFYNKIKKEYTIDKNIFFQFIFLSFFIFSFLNLILIYSTRIFRGLKLLFAGWKLVAKKCYREFATHFHVNYVLI